MPAISGVEIRFEDGHRDDVIKLKCFRHGQSLRFADVVEYWQSDPGFSLEFNDRLAGVPFAAYFWELPPMTRTSFGNPFECVLVNSPQLAAVHADSRRFSDYLRTCEAPVTAFANIGRDAWLIAPAPLSVPEAYPHLAAFARLGPVSQQQLLWQTVGQAIAQRLSDHPLWVSTSGLGVSWLHVRLDTQPKYYSWQPYKILKN